MLQKILVAIGDLPDSEKIFTAGLALAQKLDAELLLLHVLDPLVPHGLSREWKESERQGIKQLQADAAQAKERGIDVEIAQKFGDAGRMICEVAKNWSADALAEPIGTIIVMGRNQKSMLSEIWLGSTSNYVLHHAHCSTLVIQLPAVSN
jgi:nucleotide-binding universal stress UspA family protein